MPKLNKEIFISRVSNPNSDEPTHPLVMYYEQDINQSTSFVIVSKIQSLCGNSILP